MTDLNILKKLDYYKKGDNALVAIQDGKYGHILIENTSNIDDILLEVLSKYIKSQYNEFDGEVYACVNFYQEKIDLLFDALKNEQI